MIALAEGTNQSRKKFQSARRVAQKRRAWSEVRCSIILDTGAKSRVSVCRFGPRSCSGTNGELRHKSGWQLYI